MSKNHVFVIYVVRFCSNIDATVMTDCTILYDTIGYANLQIFNKQSKKSTGSQLSVPHDCLKLKTTQVKRNLQISNSPDNSPDEAIPEGTGLASKVYIQTCP